MGLIKIEEEDKYEYPISKKEIYSDKHQIEEFVTRGFDEKGSRIVRVLDKDRIILEDGLGFVITYKDKVIEVCNQPGEYLFKLGIKAGRYYKPLNKKDKSLKKLKENNSKIKDIDKKNIHIYFINLKECKLSKSKQGILPNIKYKNKDDNRYIYLNYCTEVKVGVTDLTTFIESIIQKISEDRTTRPFLHLNKIMNLSNIQMCKKLTYDNIDKFNDYIEIKEELDKNKKEYQEIIKDIKGMELISIDFKVKRRFI